ncbi:hypothetical protein JXA85_02370 [Candidatus Woesearchaeota archaeon]|nr:hypothetical protein [Candidatus Woesearchaeota archaeon]
MRSMEHNKLTGLIFVLAAGLFGYLVLKLLGISMNPYGTIVFALIVAIACIVFSALKFSRIEKVLQFYNIFMAIVAITIIVELMLGVSIKCLDILFSISVFINILLTLLFYRRYMAKAKMLAEKERKRRQMELRKRLEEKQNLEKQLNDTVGKAEKLKEENHGYKQKAMEQESILKEQKAELRKLSEKSENAEEALEKAKANLQKYAQTTGLLKEKAQRLNEKIKDKEQLESELKRKEAAEKKKKEDAEKEKKKLETELKKKELEVQKEAELKRQYSKTLRNIRKKKKQEKELLVVSNDGKSVHRPKCIVVRNIPKESRKLVKDWKTAEKEKYRGCQLCKPHVKAKTVIKNDVEYLFVASKESDKVHKAACLLVKNIESKDKLYFKTYRQALKKGYTACRICNPN